MYSTEASLLRLGERVTKGFKRNGTVINVSGYVGLLIRWDDGTKSSHYAYDVHNIHAVVYKPSRHQRITEIIDSTPPF